MNKNKKNIIYAFIPLILFLITWEFLISNNSKSVFLFSSPSRVLYSLLENIQNGILINDIIVTGTEAILGFLLGNFLGSFLGLMLWYHKRIAVISRPYIIAIGAVPIFAIAPMTIIWFGTGLYAKVMMATLSTIIIAITQSYEGARNVDDQQIKLFQSFGATRLQIFKKLIIPSSLVWVFNSFKLNISFAFLGAFIAEFISANEGLGYRIFKAGGTYDVALVLASILCIVLLVLMLTWIISLFERKYFKWK